MKRIAGLYRRLDSVQRRLWFRIAATVIAVGLAAGFFGWLWRVSADLDSQRIALIDQLRDLQLNREAAITLRQFGTISVGARTYGGPEMIQRADLFIDPQSNQIVRGPALIMELMAPVRSTLGGWTPDFLLDSPFNCLMLGLCVVVGLTIVIWINVTVQFVLTLLATLALAWLPWMLGSAQWVLAVLGVGLLGFAYVLLIRAMMILFDVRVQPLAIAHSLMKEASRTRVSLIFVLFLLACLPLLPMRLDPSTRLQFRIQTFMSNSLNLTFAVAAVMTLFLCCATVSFEIRDRQIWQLVTKPVSRMGYLFGKWIGAASINLVILIICGLSIFLYIQYLKMQPVQNTPEGREDISAVVNQVMIARESATPDWQKLKIPENDLQGIVEQVIANDAELMSRNARGEMRAEDRREIASQIQQEHLRVLRTVPPAGPNEDHGRTYSFEGLDYARETGATLTLRFRFHIAGSDEHQSFMVRFMFNEDVYSALDVRYVPTVSKYLTIDPAFIREDGTLAVSIFNIEDQSLHFEEKDLELLFQVGGFEANFLRAMLIMWIKLAFLAMLAIAASTFLSFPVACLLSFSLFIAGILGPYLAYSLEEYYPIPTWQVDFGDIGQVFAWAFTHTIRFLAQGIYWAFGSFGENSPTQRLVEGRHISWGSVGVVVGQVGLFWSGLALTVGFLVFRRRELAVYSGQS